MRASLSLSLCIMAMNLASIEVTYAGAVILFDESYTGADLDDLVQKGQAEYLTQTGTVDGDALCFSPISSLGDGVRRMLWRMPLLDAGMLSPSSLTIISLRMIIEPITWTDSDPGIGISDGMTLVAATNTDDLVPDWMIVARDEGDRFRDVFSNYVVLPDLPEGAVLDADINVGASSDVTISMYGESETVPGAFLGRQIDPQSALSLVLIGDATNEPYRISAIGIRVTAMAVPAPAAFLLAGLGVGLVNRLRRRRML